MPDFNEGIQQAKQFWATRTGTQRVLLLAGAGATVLLLVLFVRLIGAPDFKPLLTGLDPADAQTLTAQLDAQGIAHQTSVDGKTISVPGDKLDAARLQTAMQGGSHSGRIGFELFDKASWGQTEFDEKVTYQRALEGELERTIQTLGDVEAARVHLVMPTDSVFSDRRRNAKASVILKLRRGNLSRESVLAISRLVAGAVDELAPDDVSIIDADSDRSFASGPDEYGTGEGLEASLKQRLETTIGPVVGIDKMRATVNVDYDQATTEESDEKYDPSTSALLTEQKSEDQAGDASSAGIPGTSSNTPSKQKPSSTANVPTAMQRSVSESAQYGVNRVEIHRTVPAGKVQRITTAILVDDAQVMSNENGKTTYRRVKRSQDELDKIRQLAEAAIGFDPKRGDTISIQNLSFNNAADVVDIPAIAWTDRLQQVQNKYAGILRPVSLLALFLLAYLFVLRPVQKRALAPGLALQPEQTVLAAEPRGELAAKGSVPHGDRSRRAAQLKEQTIDMIKQKPADTTRAVQAWLREDAS